MSCRADGCNNCLYVVDDSGGRVYLHDENGLDPALAVIPQVGLHGFRFHSMPPVLRKDLHPKIHHVGHLPPGLGESTAVQDQNLIA